MIEFITSKFGIMLFAFSVAAVLILFVDNVRDVFLSDEGVQVTSIISRQLKEMSDSPSLCASTYVTLPRFIDVIGATNNVTSTSLFYNIEISVNSSAMTNADDIKYVVFTLKNKKNNKVISIESFLSNADVLVYKDNIFVPLETYILDPTALNTLYLIKDTSVDSQGKSKVTLRFLPCDSPSSGTESNTCYPVLKELYIRDRVYCVPISDSAVGRSDII